MKNHGGNKFGGKNQRAGNPVAPGVAGNPAPRVDAAARTKRAKNTRRGASQAKPAAKKGRG